jgi:rod shape-determining protein MreC
MFELFRVLVKNSGFILFVIFECIAFYLVINYNRPQREIFLYSSNVFSASILNQYNKVSDYFQLEQINDQLTIENANLMRQLNDSAVTGIKNDSSSSLRNSLDFIGARVISNSINQRNNYFLIDKGRMDGIQKGMGVVSGNMPVGIVHRVTNNYSDVLSFLNSDFKISSRISNSRYFGTVSWDALDSKLGDLSHIPKHAVVEIGDTLLTSGYSTIFPENLMIGVVREKVIPSGSNFYDIKIQIEPDIGKLEYIQVVKNLDKTQLDSLNINQ